MTLAPDIALAASAREWPDRLHRYLLDHGGGKVTTRIMEPEQVMSSSFDVFFIDDICSFLTPRLVVSVKDRGREVIGVFLSSDGSDAKRRLLECGISDVIETEAAPEEFVAKALATMSHRVVAESPPALSGKPFGVGVVGAAQGVGATELSASLAALIARKTEVALVDADPTAPSVAQRLDLSLHPNIRTLLDESLHGSGPLPLSNSTQTFGDMIVVGGVADSTVGSPLTRSEFSIVIDSLGGVADVVVVDLGPVDRTIAGAYVRLSMVALVGSADPVGVARLIRSAQALIESVEPTQLVLVVNKASSRPYYTGEIRAEIADVLPGVPVIVLPLDRRLNGASWEGSIPRGGPFVRAVASLARVITEVVDDH